MHSGQTNKWYSTSAFSLSPRVPNRYSFSNLLILSQFSSMVPSLSGVLVGVVKDNFQPGILIYS